MTYDREAIADFLEQAAAEGDPEILLDLREGIARIHDLPTSWAPLRRADADHRDIVAAMWRDLEQSLPQTFATVTRKLRGLAVLVTTGTPPSLLYLFGEGRDLTARRGYSPAVALPFLSTRLPVDLMPLYRLHDGWVSLFSGDSGPVPTGQWKVIGSAPGCRGFLEIMSRGSQTLGFDLDDDPARPYFLYPDDEEVEEVENFWMALDDWLFSGLRDYPDAR